MEQSEFGRGLVICLVKFLEHYHWGMANQVKSVAAYLSLEPERREEVMSSEPFSFQGGDWRKDVESFLRVEAEVYGGLDKGFSSLIHLWANGASDHLYEITVPKRWHRTRLDEIVQQLRDKGINMGHGFPEPRCTYQDFMELRALAEEAVIWIDQHIGLKRVADWGEH